jgi:hypothetical protein
MCRLFSFAVCAICVVTANSQAGPLIYSGTESVVLTNPIGGVSAGAGTTNFKFGGPGGATLSWSGGSTFTATDGVPFDLGRISLSNGAPINAPSQVTLAVNLDFLSPTGIGKQTFDFATGISVQQRDGVGTFTVSFDTGGKSTVTGPNGMLYTLELVGLSNSPGSSIYSSLSGTTCSGSSGCVLAEISAQPCGVPEPGAAILGAIGIGLCGVLRVRSRRNEANA